MKQVVQYANQSQTEVLEVPVPRPAPSMVLVRTAASLVSAGTERNIVEFAGRSLLGKARARPDLVRQTLDKVQREGLLGTLDAVQNRLEQPIPLGYSSAGTVVEVGGMVTGFRPGERVACAGGGFAVHAEYAIVPQTLLARLPEQVPFGHAAFATVGAIAMHGYRLAEVQVGGRVAVIGLGLVGLLAASIARAAGCRVMGVDIRPARVEQARQLGFQAAERSQAEQAGEAFTQGAGFDAVLICADTASDDPVELAAALSRDRGCVVATGVVGTTLPRKAYFEKELTFLVSRSSGPGRYDPAYEVAGSDYPYGYVRWTEGRNLQAFVDLMADGLIDVAPLITHRFPIERAPEAYELISSDTPSLGVLLTYTEQAKGDLFEAPASRLAPGVAAAAVRLGVLGAGNFATSTLFPALARLPEIEKVGLASASGMRAAHAARRYGFRYTANDSGRLIGDPAINTIAVLTPHHLHAELTCQALAAGKHVFCEKPLALDEGQLRMVFEAHGKTDKLLTIGFNRRFAPLAVRLKAFLETVGEPLAIHYRVNAGYLPPTHGLQDPELGGGRLIGEACHFIDFITFLIGRPPVRVRSLSLPDQGRYRQDNLQLQLEFPDGSLGSIGYYANGDHSFPKERLEAFGGGRVAVLDDFRTLSMAADGRRRTARSWLRQDKGHLAIWRSFAASIQAGGPPPIPYDQLFGVSAAAIAAQRSLRLGEPVAVDHFIAS
jgi:predicted dehydrogenase